MAYKITSVSLTPLILLLSCVVKNKGNVRKCFGDSFNRGNEQSNRSLFPQLHVSLTPFTIHLRTTKPFPHTSQVSQPSHQSNQILPHLLNIHAHPPRNLTPPLTPQLPPPHQNTPINHRPTPHHPIRRIAINPIRPGIQSTSMVQRIRQMTG